MFREIEAQERRITRQHGGVDADKVANTFGYIGGTSSSGSTLLSFLLNAQSGVASVGEVAWSVRRVSPGHFPCSCGANIENCEFWLNVSREMERRGYIFDAEHWNTAFRVSENRVLQRVAVRSLASSTADRFRDRIIHKVPGWGKHLEEIGARNAALAASVAAVTGASVFIDASKDPARVRLLREYAKIEPYVIHLVRDAPAFVTSFIRKDASKVGAAIRWWNRTAWQMEGLKQSIPAQRWLFVRYEDLCAKPEIEMTRILQFLGVAAGAPVLDFRQKSHHIIGNKMRLADSSQIRLDTAWRDQLSENQIHQIMAGTLKYRKVFGYA